MLFKCGTHMLINDRNNIIQQICEYMYSKTRYNEVPEMGDFASF